jgi:glycosyltransferase involved in cell wall biosynthesis
MHAPLGQSLKILHVFRAPVGGLFRHILDLTRGQIARGHRVGFIVDSLTGGERAAAALTEIEPQLALGITRHAIQREVGLADLSAFRDVSRRMRQIGPDVLHGHGAKGGAFLRLMRRAPGTIRVYTPHGGSLHYRPNTPRGAFYSALEWILMWRTDLFLFESAFARDAFFAQIARPRCNVRVVCNGVGEAEFAPVTLAHDATDLCFVGELRSVKGIHVLLDALDLLRQRGRRLSLTIAGDGVEHAALQEQIRRLALTDAVRFVGHVPARQGFAQGRILVVPSLFESLPYVVLEAAAAGVPIIATRVGGIPEIFGADAKRLVPPGDAQALASALPAALDAPERMRAATGMLQDRVRRDFSQDSMVEGVLDAYRATMSERVRLG